VTLWGQLRAPQAGSVQLEVLRGAVWTTLGPPRQGSAGVFSWSGELPRGTQVRAVAGPVVGPPLTLS
jgi:hypothetical protein